MIFMWKLVFGLAFVILQCNVKTFAIATSNVDYTVQTLNNCTKQELLELPDAVRVEKLFASYCNIHSLQNASLAQFNHLTTLEIIESGLTLLTDHALNGLNKLRVLSLARNNISTLKSWSNVSFNALVTLDLEHNAIGAIRLDRFVCYPNLQRLNLANNALTQLSESVFHQMMPQLKHLNLGHNRLVRIATHTFAGLHRLTHLSLHHNEIGEITVDAFVSNLHLRSLRLNNNRLVDLAFVHSSNLAHLLHLNLSHNKIKSLEDLEKTKDFELTDVDVSHNQVESVKAQTFHELYLLEHLNISHNSLHSIAMHSFSQLNSLEHIDLSSNRLKQLPGKLFDSTHSLQHINLSHNTLVAIDVSLFAGMPYLHTLDLSSNQLHSADVAFVDYLAPEMKRNELSLLLCDNQFDTLNITLLKAFKRVELAGNNWSCRWLIREMLHLPDSINFGRNYTLATGWSDALLNTVGIHCYEGEIGTQQRNIVVVDTKHVWQTLKELKRTNCDNVVQRYNEVSPTMLAWPKLRLDRFDSRSVILWMLIGIAVAFSALRVAKRLIDQKEREKKFKELRTKQQALDQKKLLSNV